ncbi:esterase-like activity of phytase family protein [Pelagovum pacificum]|uniref:esterase-like activity of phytase family protein n=1 Tax=Pelagovum pacificum TaxID=2588711 RepID=UPI0018CCFD36|nr:esterase-like activity of phytase family protein [Pelagovum pacificum]QQA42928.1 esterase-like activity of phytase family protein [Pelagovum pacificum]
MSFRTFFTAAVLAACPLVGSAEVTYLGTYIWNERHVGGVSGLELSDDGSSFVAISDRSILYRGTITRDGDRITGVTAEKLGLRRPDGGEMRDDTEGLAVAPDGTAWISLEGEARVLRYSQLDGVPTELPAHPDFAGMRDNRALEALALAPDGSLYTLPEVPGDDGLFPVYRYAGGTWSIAFRLRPREGFMAVGADFGPDGALYLLGRKLGPFGFRSQVRRIVPGTMDETVLLTTPYNQHDNLEGLAVWQDESGAIRLTMIADDNFYPIQQTEIVEYRLD